MQLANQMEPGPCLKIRIAVARYRRRTFGSGGHNRQAELIGGLPEGWGGGNRCQRWDGRVCSKAFLFLSFEVPNAVVDRSAYSVQRRVCLLLTWGWCLRPRDAIQAQTWQLHHHFSSTLLSRQHLASPHHIAPSQRQFLDSGDYPPMEGSESLPCGWARP